MALTATLALAPAGVAHAESGTFEWCPAPATYNAAACKVGVSFQDAVTKAQAAHVPGTIYVNAGTFAGNVVATGLKNVRFKGNANSGAGTTINGSLSIFDSEDIIISSFTVTGGISVEKGSGAYQISNNVGTLTVKNSKFDHNTAASGLRIDHDGDISLMRVSASRNRDHGIFINASGNILLIDITAGKNGQIGTRVGTSAGTVTASTSELKVNRFDRNGADGLSILADGAVALADISASRNVANGLSVTSGETVVIDTGQSKLNRFDRNGGRGVSASASGTLMLFDTSACKNGVDGITLRGSMIGIGVHKAKILHFDKNKVFGVNAYSSGFILLTDLTASKNGRSGVTLPSDGGVAIMTIKSKLVRFDRNGSNGVDISASEGGGAVVLADVSASGNGDDGAFLASDTSVTITTINSKLNLFNKNKGHGLLVSTSGPIALSDISAIKNKVDGVRLFNGGSVSIETLHAKLNKFDGNIGNGLYSSAGSTITIANSSASKNHGNGLLLNTPNDAASVTCSAAKKNASFDIQAELGSANLLLNSVKLTHPGLVDINFTGTGTINVSSTACP